MHVPSFSTEQKKQFHTRHGASACGRSDPEQHPETVSLCPVFATEQHPPNHDVPIALFQPARELPPMFDKNSTGEGQKKAGQPWTPNEGNVGNFDLVNARQHQEHSR